MALQLFGFEIKRKEDELNKNKVVSFVQPNEGDGSVSVTTNVPGSGGTMSSIIDLDGVAKSEAEIVQKYRDMLQQPEVQMAVDDVVNEAINITYDEAPVTCVTDDIPNISDGTKKKIRDEFDNILRMLDFSNYGYDIFQKWYVDGRLNYHVVIDEKNPRDGVRELRYVDPRKIRKIREYEKVKIGEGPNTSYVNRIKNEYYIYVENGFLNDSKSKTSTTVADFQGGISGLRISVDSIVNCSSGLLNEKNTVVLSHLHKAIKPLNQLRMMEDASVVYRISRAPERRVFYIDVGNLPKAKAEQYLRDMMTKHKNRLVYDANSGEVRDDRKHMSMTDDFWLPRREGGKGTEITTLPGGQNLGEMEDIVYFQKRLYKALNVPVSRLEQDTGFALGRSSEISRDEVKFSKFIRRLRARFSILFDKILEKQLILKGIITPEDWDKIQNTIRYDFMLDNHFEELKQAEILQNRLQILRDVEEYTGTYYSKKWVRKNILQMTDDEIEDMKDEIEKESEEEPSEDEEDMYNEVKTSDKVIQEYPVEIEEERTLSDEDRKLIESFSETINRLVTDDVEDDNE